MNSTHHANTTFPSAATNMLLAYDTAEAGRNALVLLHCVAAQLKNTVAFNTKLWQFDLMTLPECASQSKADAADAIMILLAIGAGDAVAPSLFHWLEGWGEDRRIQNAALGVLPIGAAARHNGQIAVATLRSLAQRHGVGFICLDQPAKGEELAALVCRLEQGNPPPPLPFQFMNQNRYVPLSEWGIND